MKKPPAKSTIEVQGIVVSIVSQRAEDYICLTDIARFKDAYTTDDLIRNWLRNRNTIEFLGIWERLHNPGFNPVEFDGSRMQAGLNSFAITPKQWIERTGAIGIVSKAGRYGGTYAHKDIAFEFASWISVEFKFYLIKEFQRLKEDESRRLSLAWNLNRPLSKLNYRIHTDAIKEHLIPPEVTPAQAAMTYASEADLLNVALFGGTARQWRTASPALIAEYQTQLPERALLLRKLHEFYELAQSAERDTPKRKPGEVPEMKTKRPPKFKVLQAAKPSSAATGSRC